MECTVELFGTLRQLMKTSEVKLKLPPGASLKDLVAALVEREAGLLEGVVDPKTLALSVPYRLYQEGRGFVDDLGRKVERGDRFVLMSVAVGG